MINEITPEQLAGAVAYFISNPDKLSAEQKTALAGIVAPPKTATTQEPIIEMTETSRGIASSNAKLQSEIAELKQSLKQQQDAAILAVSSALQEQESKYLNEMHSQKEREKIISSMYKIMPREAVDKMVSDKVTTDTLKFTRDIVTKSGATMAGVAKGLEIRSSIDNLKTEITKLGYSEITFDKGMVE